MTTGIRLSEDLASVEEAGDGVSGLRDRPEKFGVDHDYTITEEPMVVGGRGRCYTTENQRSRLGIQGFGYGKHCYVLARTPISLVGHRASGCRVATAKVRLSENGEFTLPKDARDYLGVEHGDTVVVTARRAD